MKHITIKDIARQLSLSVSTVSRALMNDKNIRKETKEKVLETAKALGYKPNPVAINLKYGHTNTVGVIVPEMVTPFASQVINGIQSILYANGLKVIIAVCVVIKKIKMSIIVFKNRKCLWFFMIVFLMV